MIPTQQTRRKSFLGFTMIEVLIVLGLLGIIMLVADRLFVSGMHASSSSAHVQNQAMTLDSAVSALRADCWSAQKMTAAATQATLTPPGDAEPITWTSARGTLARHSPGNPDRTWPIGADVNFATDGPALLVQIVPNQTTPGAQLRLINEVELINNFAVPRAQNLNPTPGQSQSPAPDRSRVSFESRNNEGRMK